jgi:hypothetical protein
VADRSDAKNKGAHTSGAALFAPPAIAWFIREILPLEAALTQYLHHNWRNKAEIPDLRQDIYVKVYEASRKQIHPFICTTLGRTSMVRWSK